MQREGQDLETKELLETLTNVFHTTHDYTSRVLRQVEKIKTIISAEDVML